MLKKWISISLSCLTMMGSVQASEPQNELTFIDQQIQMLKAHLQEYHVEERQEDVQGQDYMGADWEKYADQLEHIHEQQGEARQIRQQIEKLEQRKAQLLQQQQAKGS